MCHARGQEGIDIFTGIIEEMGCVRRLVRKGGALVLTVDCQSVLTDLKIGDSVAVNGSCLTATRVDDSSFTADVSGETIKRTTLGNLRVGSQVNLERALAAGERFGGHFVSGHVDATAVVTERRQMTNAVLFRFKTAPEWATYMVDKGSIAVDGISLTIFDVAENGFSVTVIPHTLRETTLYDSHVGDRVNIECDMIGKYVVKVCLNKAEHAAPAGVSIELLKENGFI